MYAVPLQLTGGQAAIFSAKCPSDGCHVKVGEDVFRRFLKTDDLGKALHFAHRLGRFELWSCIMSCAISTRWFSIDTVQRVTASLFQ